MKTCDNKDCDLYHKDLVEERMLDTEFENTGEEVEICKWCGHLAYYMDEEINAEDKAIADKAAELIARDYGEVLKRLEDE